MCQKEPSRLITGSSASSRPALAGTCLSEPLQALHPAIQLFSQQRSFPSTLTSFSTHLSSSCSAQVRGGLATPCHSLSFLSPSSSLRSSLLQPEAKGPLGFLSPAQSCLLAADAPRFREILSGWGESRHFPGLWVLPQFPDDETDTAKK